MSGTSIIAQIFVPLRKAGMYPAFIYLFIYLFIYFYFFLFSIFVRVYLECKDVED